MLQSSQYLFQRLPGTQLVKIIKRDNDRVKEGSYIFNLEYYVSLQFTYCTCPNFFKKATCKHLLAAFSYCGQHSHLGTGDLRPIQSFRVAAQVSVFNRSRGRGTNQPRGALNSGVRRGRQVNIR